MIHFQVNDKINWDFSQLVVIWAERERATLSLQSMTNLSSEHENVIYLSDWTWHDKLEILSDD